MSHWNAIAMATIVAVGLGACGKAASDGTSLGQPGNGQPGNGQPGNAGGTSDDGSAGDAYGIFGNTPPAGGADAAGQASGQDGGMTSLQENPGNVPPNVQQQLGTSGKADSRFRWLYPYDATVFPQGLLPPTLQFDGDPADAVYVHLSNPRLDYKGFYGPANPAQVTFATATWNTITQAAGGTGSVRVEVTKISAGQVTGPIVETWRIAPGSLRGAVYYSSYDSQLANGPAVLRIDPGMPVPAVLLQGMQGGCVGCHSVSADGSTMVVALQHTADVTVDLANNNTQLFSAPSGPDNHLLTFAGLVADGTLALTCENCGDNAWGNQNIGPSRLINPRTGQMLAAPGFDTVVGAAGMPSFSADGKKIVFNLYGHQTPVLGSWEYAPGHDLALMDFDRASSTFSNLVKVAHDATLFPTWPVITPDGQWVIYQLGSATYTRDRATGNLAAVHVASGTIAMLDALNGLSGGKPYIPFPDDTDKDYEPTILPVAVGGYFWVVFTTRREYGNTLNETDPWPHTSTHSRKKLWVAAIDIDDPNHPSTSAHDISHPAFYLPGQELGSGNSRGFWALSPCKHLGNTCTPGTDDCCDGSCRLQPQGDGATGYACSPQQGCSQEFEKCTTAADCCDTGYRCIGGYCARPPV